MTAFRRVASIVLALLLLASGAAFAQSADLAVTKSVSNSTPNVGDTITFTVTLTNNGPDTATNVTVQDLLPAGLTFVSATPSQGTYSSGTGVWTVGTVTTVTPQTLVIQATVASPNAQTNTATISHSDQSDPNTSNNSSSSTVTIGPPAAIPALSPFMLLLLIVTLLAFGAMRLRAWRLNIASARRASTSLHK